MIITACVPVKGHPCSQGANATKLQLSICVSSNHTHSGKMITRPEKVKEAMGTTRDTTILSSWGTCNG